MDAWSFFFVLTGACVATAQLFRIADLIERPARRRPRAAAK